jgi:hypothetical protein
MDISRKMVLACLAAIVFLVQCMSNAAGPAPLHAIGMLPADGANLTLADQLSPHRVLVEVAPTAHNWFAGTFTHLPVDGPVTIGFSMTGRDSRGIAADVAKWRGLAPVMTYADPARYESYEWFRRDARGRWISGDIFKPAAARFAGAGAVPEQHAIPAEVAAQFLAEDGRFWAPWREVDGTETLTGVNIFRVTHAFSAPSATVAMRIPFTYTYLQQYLTRLRAAGFPGLSVEEIGETKDGRKLQIVRLDDPEARDGAPPAKTILLTAREHATEPASSWVLAGALAALLPPTPEARGLRRGTTWLVLPILDPDGSAHAAFDPLTELFREAPDNPADCPEAFAYARYFTQYIYEGRNIDVAVSLHNVEANESEQVVSPFVTLRDRDAVLQFNQAFFQSLAAQGFVTGDPLRPWGYGFTPFRLYGWCSAQFGAFGLAFEVNDRYPQQRLSLDRLQAVGGVLATTLAGWLATPEGDVVRARAAQLAKLKRLERAVHYRRAGYGPEARTSVDLIRQGF